MNGKKAKALRAAARKSPNPRAYGILKHNSAGVCLAGLYESQKTLRQVSAWAAHMGVPPGTSINDLPPEARAEFIRIIGGSAAARSAAVEELRAEEAQA